jgi:Lon protease-like protein
LWETGIGNAPRSAARELAKMLAAQKKAKTNDPTAEDIFGVGTLGTIIQLLRLPDGTVKVLVEGKRRASIRRFLPSEECFQVEIEELEDAPERAVELEALVRGAAFAGQLGDYGAAVSAARWPACRVSGPAAPARRSPPPVPRGSSPRRRP